MGKFSECLQAMSAGRAVIATKHTGFAEQLDEGRTGWLVPPLNPRQVASAIVNALESPDTCRALGELARERLLGTYSAERAWPLIEQSVVLPVYNAEKYIAQAVQSILEQTFGNFEFLIVDDGSTDGSLKILRRFADQDSRIRLISRPNTGYVIALNEMLELATGEFVARMDADDIALPERFAKQIEHLRSNRTLIALGTRAMLVDPQDNDLCVMEMPLDHDAIDQQNLRGVGFAICHPALMFRREVLSRIGGYKPEFWPAENVEFFLRLAEAGQIANIEYVGLRYRLHHESVGHTSRLKQINSAQRASASALERRGLPAPSVAMPEAESVADATKYCMRWAWWAFRGGNIRTARKYAWKSLIAKPWDIGRWRLLACCLRGY